MKRYRFNESQKVEYNRRVKEYSNQNYFLKDARVMARRDVENIIWLKMNHKWEYDKNGLDRKCAKCGARSHKNLIREKAWGMPYLKGEPKLECGQPNSPDR